MPWRAFLFVLPLAAMRLVQEDPFPTSCQEGILNLAGRYKVSSQITIEQSCRILAVKAVIVLEAQLFFQHDASFEGSMHFLGQDHRGGQRRCVDVEGNALFTKGKITFEDCGGLETEDGGGIYVEKSLALSMSSVVFKNCRAEFGGGAFVKESFRSTSSSISFYSCHGPGGGGGMFVIGNVSVDSSSQLFFESCRAEKGEGGGLNVGGANFTTGGELSFKNCSALSGGGLYMHEPAAHFSQEGGNITASFCEATHSKGGGMSVMNLVQQAGHMDFRYCAARMEGGAFCANQKVSLWGTSNFEHLSGGDGGAFFGRTADVMGNVRIRNTRGSSGGAIFVAKMLKISGGDIYIQDSSAMIAGGALVSTQLQILSGQVHIQDSMAIHSGGGLHLMTHFLQVGGRLVLSNTSSTRGGAIKSTWLVQKGGRILITNSYARQFSDGFRKPAGGALALKGGLGQAQPGEIVIRNAFSEGHGGGMITPLVISHGTFTINNASAARDGGCIMVAQYVYDHFTAVATYRSFVGKTVKALQVAASRKAGVLKGPRRPPSHGGVSRTTMLVGNTTFESCRAQIGGAIYARGTVKIGEVAFSNCYASSIEGGAVLVAESAKFFSPLQVTNCSTPKGAVFHLKKQLWIKNVTFRNCSAPQAAAELINAKRVVVRAGSGEAALFGQQRRIDELHCDNGVEGFVDTYGTICRQCRNGYYQLQGGHTIFNGTVAGDGCVKVPQQAVVAAGILKLRPGYMLQAQNFSMSLHCPNEMACPGGVISKVGIENMCENGYEGPGCVNCVETHGRGSGDPFICSACATSRFRKAAEWTIYVLQQTVVFAVSASGVIFAGEESYKSTIYSNQLMAYVMVSLPVLRQLTNSKSFKTLASLAQEMIEAFSIPVDVANGGGSEGQSVECLLDYVGISKTPYGGDLLFLMLALFLMLLLAMIVDVWSAVVVAGNCYLPRLCFGFGRHLACYRLHSELHGDEQLCGFEKDVSMPRPVAAVLLVLCFMVGAGSWLWLIRHQEQIDSPGVAYLIQPYKQHSQNWEVTVLVRKVLLAVVCAVWPSSFNATMQLEVIGMILLVSLVITLQRSPYVSEEHNQTEARLLVSAVLMVLTTFCFHANENSWARTESSQRITLAFIVLLATGPALVMTVRTLLALIEEFRTLYREEQVRRKAKYEESTSEAAS